MATRGGTPFSARKVAQLWQEFEDLLGTTEALRERGRLAVAQGKYAQAVQTLHKGLTIFNEVGISWDGVSLSYLGAGLRLQGDYEAAEQSYNQLLDTSKAIDHQPWIALCLSGLGCLAYDRGEYRQAEQRLQKTLTIWEAIGNEPEMVSVWRHLGHVMAALGHHRAAEARQYFKQTLQLATKHRLVPVALDVFIGAAGLLARGGETQSAVELVALAEQHTASTHETKEQARRYLTELAASLPEEVVTVNARCSVFSTRVVSCGIFV